MTSLTLTTPSANIVLTPLPVNARPSPSADAERTPSISADGRPDPELVRIRDLIYQVAGIFHPDTKLRLLLDRCNRRMKAVNLGTLCEYRACLTIKPGHEQEMTALLNEITIGETSFFRNQPQLEALRQVVIPRLLALKNTAPSRRLRIWTAGCSTGEEPYTLAILALEESLQILKGWTVEILATDLNELSLAHARTALYNAYSTRYLPQRYRNKYFTSAGDLWQLDQPARQKVAFDRLNLSDESSMLRMTEADIIFCCNVLIYFDVASKRRVIGHFYNTLLPHGYLFLGQSESLYGVSENFRLVHLPGSTAYIKTECGSAERPAP
ncbi:MAG TPA: protein-glutamate O-methyltransferase CheR [Candidatus Sulfotelmatobacter sp.]